MKFDFKNGKTYFGSLISPSFDELHCYTIVHMNHMEHMFQDLPFYCTKKVPKYHNHFFHFCHGGGTHFLLLACVCYNQNLLFLFLSATQLLSKTRKHLLLQVQNKLAMMYRGPTQGIMAKQYRKPCQNHNFPEFYIFNFHASVLLDT